MQELYATAILRLMSKGKTVDEIVSNLMKHLEETGRTKLLPGILRELKRAHAREKISGTRIEVAKEKDASEALAKAKAAGIEADKAVVNTALLSGWRARTKGMLIDRSGKRALIDLYARIVK